MKVLIACEESQTVCIEFRKLGHEAYSCDILSQSGGHPEWHIQGDVLEQLNVGWDMMIAHPPCTYLSNAGARHLYPNGVLNQARLQKGLQAKEFFMKLYDAKIPRICLENPLPSTIFELPKPAQIIQPFQFGHPFKKRTQLWLRGLPELKHTNVVEFSESTKIAGNWFNIGGIDRQRNRSKTFQGIAIAMATQWGCLHGDAGL
jgi:hypothetical protein